MTTFYDLQENETLDIDLNDLSDAKRLHNSSICIGFPVYEDGEQPECEQYISIIVNGSVHIFPTLEEVDLIVDALISAKKMVIEKYGM